MRFVQDSTYRRNEKSVSVPPTKTPEAMALNRSPGGC
jgi:hypothetical protein